MERFRRRRLGDIEAVRRYDFRMERLVGGLFRCRKTRVQLDLDLSRCTESHVDYTLAAGQELGLSMGPDSSAAGRVFLDIPFRSAGPS